MKELAVLIPVFNDQQGIEYSLNNLANENMLFDIIIVDDGSTPQIIVPDVIGNKNIYFLRLPKNRGIEHALNEGLKYIIEQGYSYIARLDSGDGVVTGRFEKHLGYLSKETRCAIVGSWVEFINEDHQVVFVQKLPEESHEIVKKMHINSCFSHPAVTFRTKAVIECGLYSDKFPAAEDYELFFRFVQNYESYNFQEILTKTEFDPNGISLKKRKTQLKSRLRIQLAYFNFRVLESYIGLLQTIFMMVLPKRSVIFLKKVFRKK